MAKTESFDVTTGCDLQEVDNAVNQALKEITGRYDFKGIPVTIEYDRAAGTIELHTASEFNLNAAWEVLLGRMVARSIPIKNVQRGTIEPAGGDTVRQTVTLVQAIDGDTARRISKFVRDQKLKKVQAQIQGDAVRISGANRDDLQVTIRALREEDWGIELNFGNYR
ncbi:MAG: YajQ family cyclic di-GMP-binding protein [Chloroflexi bacterium]|nr:YajQ family cyclic di-GMP-binding protein [Chloroflexota bacterium]